MVAARKLVNELKEARDSGDKADIGLLEDLRKLKPEGPIPTDRKEATRLYLSLRGLIKEEVAAEEKCSIINEERTLEDGEYTLEDKEDKKKKKDKKQKKRKSKGGEHATEKKAKKAKKEKKHTEDK
eukprot:evm.model.scf_1495.1 EVM.evm.TU.scf_1495.1   scf_1495:10947-11448(-)